MCFMEIMTNLYFFGVIHTQCKLSQPSLQTDFSPPPLQDADIFDTVTSQ